MTANTSPQVYQNKVRQVAGAVFIVRLPTPHVLLVSSRSDPSRWILPKGGHEAKDGSPQTAALRESWEEAGVRALHPDHAVLLGTLEHTPKGKPHKPQKFFWYGYAADSVDSTAAAPALQECAAGEDWPEHKIRERAWFPLAEARKVLTKSNMVPALEWAVEKFGLIDAQESNGELQGTTIPVLSSVGRS